MYVLDNRLLVDLGNLTCRFTFPVRSMIIDGAGSRAVIVPASIGGDAHGPTRNLRCRSPDISPDALLSSDGHANATIDFSLNGADYASSAQNFTYHSTWALKLHSILPWGGPAAGNVTVYLFGRFMSSDLTDSNHRMMRCWFGGQQVPGTLINQSHAICVSPPYPQLTGRPSSAVAICLMLNGQQCLPAGARLMFTYHTDDWGVLRELSPDMGPAEGRTLVNISGRNLVNFGSLSCVFSFLTPGSASEDGRSEVALWGQHTVVASVRSTELVTCSTPPVLALLAPRVRLSVRVSVTLNGDPHHTHTSGLTFTYYGSACVHISTLWPQAGPAAGGTPVTLIGVGLSADVPSMNQLCRFGSLPPVRAFPQDRYSVPPASTNATGCTESAVICISPALQASLGTCMGRARLASESDLIVPVSFTLNGGNPSTEFYKATMPFGYFPDYETPDQPDLSVCESGIS